MMKLVPFSSIIDRPDIIFKIPWIAFYIFKAKLFSYSLVQYWGLDSFLSFVNKNQSFQSCISWHLKFSLKSLQFLKKQTILAVYRNLVTYLPDRANTNRWKISGSLQTRFISSGCTRSSVHRQTRTPENLSISDKLTRVWPRMHKKRAEEEECTRA